MAADPLQDAASGMGTMAPQADGTHLLAKARHHAGAHLRQLHMLHLLRRIDT